MGKYYKMLVKICGVKDVEAAQVALESGADMIGMIFVPGKPRTIQVSNAKEVVSLVESKRKGLNSNELYDSLKPGQDSLWFEQVHDSIKSNGPYSVGVFRNQSIEEINNIIEEVDIDFVQLHGQESHDEYIPQLKKPVITRFVPNETKVLQSLKPNKHLLPLFDSEAGGEGVKLNWSNLSDWSAKNNARYLLAGGLTPDNVHEAIKLDGVIGVDVSGGVETNGVKDYVKIKEFVKNALQ